jgi:hypothetical protein
MAAAWQKWHQAWHRSNENNGENNGGMALSK